MKKIIQTLSALLLLTSAAFAQQQELAEKQETVRAVETVEGNQLKSDRKGAAEKNEKYREEMIGLMKSSGFEGEQIEKYLEISRKAESQLEQMQREGQLNEADMDMNRKKIYLNQEEELKKIFGEDRYEKFLEMRRQVYGNE